MPRDPSHIRQAPGGCAEAALAMLLRCDLELARFALGQKSQPGPRELRAAVSRFGHVLARRRPLRGGALPAGYDRGVLLLRQRGQNPRALGHLAALTGDGMVRDPALPRAVYLGDYPRHARRLGLRVTGWIPAYWRYL